MLTFDLHNKNSAFDAGPTPAVIQNVSKQINSSFKSRSCGLWHRWHWY